MDTMQPQEFSFENLFTTLETVLAKFQDERSAQNAQLVADFVSIIAREFQRLSAIKQQTWIIKIRPVVQQCNDELNTLRSQNSDVASLIKKFRQRAQHAHNMLAPH
jgi:hypothetical protein